MMADVNTFWQWAVSPFIRESVCSVALPAGTLAKPKSSIAASSSASPNPARPKFRAVWRNWPVLINFRPECLSGHSGRV